MKIQNKKNLKTLVIAGDDKGGVTKSTSCANIADALVALGYTVRLGDGDQANKTLTQIIPTAVPVEARNQSALDEFIGNTAASLEDITLLDMPGTSGQLLNDYFSARGFEVFSQMGIRVVTAITLTQTPDSVRGALTWIETFLDSAEFVVFANERDTPADEQFSLNGITAGKEVLIIAEGRIVTIPQFSSYMKNQYDRHKATPSSYLQGGNAAEKLGLNLIQSALWQTHLNRVVNSVSQYAQWLTGHPIPKPPHPSEPTTMGVEKKNLLRDLRAQLG